MLEYYLKLKLSCFDSGFTIPREYEECFIQNTPLTGTRKITLNFKRKKYDANIMNANGKKANPFYAVRWSKDFIDILKKEFLYSYITLMDAKQNKFKHNFHNEVLRFRAIDPYTFECDIFIKEITEFDNLFYRLVEEDFFGWIKSTDKDQLIVNTTEWLDIKLLPLHKDNVCVIYYLIDENKKEIYIGSANRLGDRVEPGRPEIPEWNKFRYDVIKPEYKHLKQRIENQIISAFARIMDNNIKNILPLKISDYKLVNKICYHK
jgi:hypothetical protein